MELVHQPLGGFHGVFGLQIQEGEFSALGEEAFVPVTDSSELGLFVLEDYHAGDWTLEAGLRFDRDERDPDTSAATSAEFDSLSASASALWDLSLDWQLGLSLSRAERAPATEELYSNVEAMDPHDYVLHAATGAIEVGDSELDTEISNNLDFSVSWALREHRLNITLFYNDFSDYINLMNTGAQVDAAPVLQYVQGDAEFYGVEIDSEFGLAEFAGGELRLGLFGDNIRGELDSGADVPRLPPHRIGSRLSWSAQRLELWGQVIDAADQDRPGDNEEATAGYTRWDLGVDYRLPLTGSELLLFAKLNNASDEEIRLSTSFLRDVAPEAGRSIEAGFRLLF